MKREIFNQYVDMVCEMFSITREQFFTKSKSISIVKARQMVYYLCDRRQIKPRLIEEWMCDNGYATGHSTIIYGIRTMKETIRGDNDYVKAIGDIERSVS